MSLLSQHNLSPKERWFLGLLNLLVVIVLWVLSSFLVNDIFEKNLYRKPFMITYVNTGSFIFYLLPFLVKHRFNYSSFVNEYTKKEPTSIGNSYGSQESLHIEDSNEESIHAKNLISLKETVKLSAQFCIIWYVANLTTNASLSYTSVASQTILSSTSSFFTLFLGYLVAIEKINSKKVVALLMSLVGVALITDTDTSTSDPSSSIVIFFGNLLALTGALFYGVYTILLKLRVKDESNLNMKIFFGFVGFFNIVLIWPSLLIFHFTGVERLEMPSSGYVWKVLLINCSLTFISDFCWAKAMLLTSPLTVTVGLSFTIPFAMLGDYLFKESPMNWIYILGAIIVSGSFLVINNDEEADLLEEDEERLE